MAYGFEVSTSGGTKNTFGLNTARVVRFYNATSIAGSAIISEFDSSNGDYVFVMGTYAAYQQALSWNNTTKTITWSKHTSSIPNSAYSSDFYIVFFHYR